MNVTLIMIITMSGCRIGGIGIDTQQYQSMQECEAVKTVFLNDIALTSKDMFPSEVDAIFSRNAKCIPHKIWPDSEPVEHPELYR